MIGIFARDRHAAAHGLGDLVEGRVHAAVHAATLTHGPEFGQVVAWSSA